MTTSSPGKATSRTTKMVPKTTTVTKKQPTTTKSRKKIKFQWSSLIIYDTATTKVTKKTIKAPGKLLEICSNFS